MPSAFSNTPLKPASHNVSKSGISLRKTDEYYKMDEEVELEELNGSKRREVGMFVMMGIYIYWELGASALRFSRSKVVVSLTLSNVALNRGVCFAASYVSISI